VKFAYGINKFAGVVLSAGSTNGQIIKCENFDVTPSENATSLYHGFLNKFPKSSTVGDDIGNQICRGLFLFVPSAYSNDGTLAYVQAFSDGTVRWLTGGAWTTLNSALTNLHFSFVSYNYLDLMFSSNGKEGIYKWKYGWTEGSLLQDKDGTAVALTGTLTFTEYSPYVTAVGGAFTTELEVGSWIRRAATDDYWYEVQEITDNDNLILTALFEEATGAGGAGTSQKAALCAAKGRVMKVWKDRLFVAAGDNS